MGDTMQPHCLHIVPDGALVSLFLVIPFHKEVVIIKMMFISCNTSV